MSLNAKWRRSNAVWLTGALAAASLAAAAQQPAPQPAPQAAPQGRSQSHSQAAGVLRVQLRPRLVPGVTMRYQIEVESTSDTTHGGVVKDPQGPSRLIVTWNATVRMEVLSGNAS